jgi:triosephosphate isomerase
VAYEPVWAIGTGRAATPTIAQETMAIVRATLSELFGSERAASVPLLYGGSCNADNVASFVRQPDIDGALVGGASLRAASFVQIVNNAAGALAGR